jgi:hypothetical protein
MNIPFPRSAAEYPSALWREFGKPIGSVYLEPDIAPAGVLRLIPWVAALVRATAKYATLRGS